MQIGKENESVEKREERRKSEDEGVSVRENRRNQLIHNLTTEE